MRNAGILGVLLLGSVSGAAELESRVLTHYLPQDFLEQVVRKEGWSELLLQVKGGTRKGDVVRIWAGGSIDRGNGDRPGTHCGSPSGVDAPASTADLRRLALSTDPSHGFAILLRTESGAARKCLPEGKPLEIPLSKDKEKLSIGFNDLKGLYRDNHLGKGLRHERDPMWMRIEVVRTIVD